MEGNMVFLESHALEKERGKASYTSLPVEHFRNSVKCDASALCRPSILAV